MNGGMILSFFKRPIPLLTLKTFGEHNGEVSSFFAHGSNHSCGVMILVRSDLEFNPRTISCDDEGRSIIIEAEVQGSPFLFVNIYAPNKVQDQCRFFDKLNKNIEDRVVNEELRIILGGDFNVTLDSDLDCSGGRPFRKDSVKHIQDLCLVTKPVPYKKPL